MKPDGIKVRKMGFGGYVRSFAKRHGATGVRVSTRRRKDYLLAKLTYNEGPPIRVLINRWWPWGIYKLATEVELQMQSLVRRCSKDAK